MSIKHLPLELLREIFAYVEDITQLVECRVACKQWDSIAEKVLLGKPICITNKNAAWGFYRHINKDELNQNSVRSLEITGCNAYDADRVYVDDDDNPCRKILPLIFTTKLEVLDGDMDEMEYYEQMLQIIAQKPTGSKFKLTRIPLPAEQESVEYQEVVVHFAETMQEVHLMIASETLDNEKRFIEKLKDFTCLTILRMTIERTDFDTMDLVVENCSRLQELDISYTDTLYMTQPQVQNRISVTNRTLKLLKVDNCFSCNLVEYLVGKYSKIEMATVDMTAANPERNGFLDIENPHLRMVDAIRKVPMFELRLYVDHGNSLEEIVTRAIGDNSSEVTEYWDPVEGLAQINVKLVQN